MMKAFFKKVMGDNIGFLASALAWAFLTSIIPIMVGLVAISSLFLRDASSQASTVTHLSAALQGVVTKAELTTLVKLSTQHAGLLGIIGFVGVLWGGSNVGGAISTVFQPIFQVKGRNFIIEKLLDIGMIFVFAILMIIIVAGTSAGALLNKLFSNFPLPSIAQFIIGIAISLLAAFLLFAVTYMVFPNTKARFKLHNVFPGAAIAAVLFTALSAIWPLYSNFAHFSKYGAVLGALLVLTAWLYFLSIILLVGAEFVSFGALREAGRKGEQIGPPPEGSVPQRGDEQAQKAAQESAASS